MLKKYLRCLYNNEKGITGLETAIILIAFVVVAAVFAYTVLSAGLFATQKSQEAIYAGLQEAQSTLTLRGGVILYKGSSDISNSVGKVEITVNTYGNDKVDLTPPYTLDEDGALTAADGNPNRLQIAFSDNAVAIPDCAWTVKFIGRNNGDNILDTDEKAVITVWLHDLTYVNPNLVWSNGANPPFMGSDYLGVNQQFTIEVKGATGAVLGVERTTPAVLDNVIDLH